MTKLNAEGNVSEPMEAWVERVIDRALLRHEQSCRLTDRVARNELRIERLIGFMIGSGAIGGLIGAALGPIMRLGLTHLVSMGS